MSETSPQTVSLNEIGLQYMQGLQRLSDMIVFHWAGARVLNEQTYDELYQSVPGLPSTQFHLRFDGAKEETERWMLKQSVNEMINLCNFFLEDIRRLCALIKFNTAREQGLGNLSTLAADVNTSSGPLDLNGKIAKIKETYGVQIPLEAELLSLLSLGRCLFQTHGIVSGVPSVTLRLKVIVPPTKEEPQTRMADYERVWNSGEKVSLARQEHAAIFTTLSFFIGGMLTELQEFAKRSGLSPDAAQQ